MIVYLWPPARSLCGPADLSLTHAASYPITSLFLLHNNLTGRTMHGFSVLDEILRRCDMEERE